MRINVGSAIVLGVVIAVSACSGGGGANAPLPLGTAPPNSAGAALGPSSSAITEFPIVAGDSGPMAIAVARDGNPWFLSAKAVNRLTSAGAITQFTSPEFDRYNSATDIINGLDGNLWFTANCAVADEICFGRDMRFVRSTTSGAFTILQTNAGDTNEGAFQSGLANGNGGTIWAVVPLGLTVSSNGSAYEEFKTDGSVVVPLQHLPQPCIEAVGAPSFGFYTAGGIAVGGDGAAYIAASSPCGDFPVPQGVSVVLRIDQSGTLTNTFPVPDATRIVQGPDKNLWITQGGTTNAIGRLTPAGVLTEFPLPTRNAGPVGITLGNDGNVWFTESNASKIGRITINGAITEFSTPTKDAGPYGIAALAGECGPGHGDIWFTESKANKIGRLLF